MKYSISALLTVLWALAAQANSIETTVNQTIPDGDLSGLASTVNLSGLTAPIFNLEVELNVSGTYNGDLYVYLTHGSGFTVLLNRVGTTASDNLGYGDGGMNVTFSGNAPDIHDYRLTLSGNASTALSGPLTGTWSPDGRAVSPLSVTDADPRTASLSSFQGLDPNGQWTLFVADVSGGDLHQLNSWGLELNAPATPVPDSGDTFALLLVAFGVISFALVHPWPSRLAHLQVKKGRCQSTPEITTWEDRSAMRRILSIGAGALLFSSTGLQGQPLWFHGFPISPPHAIPSVAAGGGFSLGLKADGTVLAVGLDDFGQCDVGGWSGIKEIGAGQQHSVGLHADGTVVAAGANWAGQGNVTSWSGIVAASAGGYETMGLKADGTVLAVGSNDYGQCNVGNWQNIVAISSGGLHAAGLKADGTAVAVGYNFSGQCDVSGWNGLVAVSAGFSHTVGLKADGTVLAVGENTYGECNVGDWNNIVAISTGSYHTVGLKSDGTVVAVGNNFEGACDVSGWKNMVAVAAGNDFTVGLRADSTVTVVGNNYNHETETWEWYLGSAAVPPIITRLPNAQTVLFNNPAQFQVSAAGLGTLQYRWYHNDEPLSDDARISGSASSLLTIQNVTPSDQGNYVVKVSSDYGVTTTSPASLNAVSMPPRPHHKVAAGGNLTVGARADGTVISSDGNNLGWKNIVSLATDGNQTIGLKADGTVVATALYNVNLPDLSGWNGVVAVAIGPRGPLGLTAAGRILSSDLDVSSWTSMIGMAEAQSFILGIKVDGTVLSTSQFRTDPARDWTGIVDLAIGSYHTVGLKSDGTVVAGGDDSQGQCDVGSWTDIVAIAAGAEHTVGLKSDGTVVAVGNRDNGRCDVSGWTDIVEIAAGNAHTVGLKADGTVVAVGLDFPFQPDIFNWYLGPEDVAPIFTRVVVNEKAILGGPFDCTAIAAGPGTIRYQWNRAGTPLIDGGRIHGATTSTLRIENTQSADEGIYSVTAENENGLTLSPDITLQVVVPVHQIPNILVNVGLRADGTVISTAGGTEGWNEIVAIGIAGSHILGVKADGTVTGTSLGLSLKDVNDWTDIIAVAGGVYQPTRSQFHENVIGLRADGTVVAAEALNGARLNVLSDLGDVSHWMEIVAIASNSRFVMGLKADGTVVTTGPFHGAVGAWKNITAIAMSDSHALGLTADGTVVATGNNDSGQCNVSSWTGIIAIAAGGAHSVGLKSDHTLVAVGANDQGQCDVSSWRDIVAVAAGGLHTMGLKSNGTVISTADNSFFVFSLSNDTSGWYLGPAGVPPIFTRPPQNEVAILGGPARFQSLAAGPGTISYQWYRNGVLLTDDQRVNGAASATLIINSTRSTDEDDYTVIASNASGSTSSEPVTLRTFAMPPHRIPNVAGSYDYTLGLKIDGTALTAGWDGVRYVRSWANLIAVAASSSGAAGLRSDGTVVTEPDSLYGTAWVNETNWTGITAISVGASHTIGLRADGTVVIAGDAANGRKDVVNWEGIVAIAAGDYHSVGVKSDGTVLALGVNTDGECNVGSWNNIVSVAAGSRHTVGLKSDGTVVAVGFHGTEGPGQASRDPTAVNDWSSIVAIAAGGDHTVGLRADGTVVAVGDNSNGECNVASWNNITAVSAGLYLTVGVRADGTVVAVGNNDYGQLDTGGWNLGVLGEPPQLAESFGDAVAILGGLGRFQISVLGEGPLSYQWYHNGNPISDDGRVTGSKTAILLIAGSSQADEGEYKVVVSNPFGSLSPAAVVLRTFQMPAHSIPNIAAGGDHTVGLKSDGSVIATGFNDPAIDPECEVANWSGIVAIAAGGSHTAGLKADGTVLAVGPIGPLGDSLSESINVGATDVEDWTGISELAAGGATTFGIRPDGSVLAVGLNDYHQRDLSGWSQITAIAGGDHFTVGLRSDGSALAIGDNTLGQCNVSGWSGIKALTAGSYHTVGLKTDGTVLAVGDNTYGQCAVGSWKNIVAVSAGIYHTIGLKADGSVLAVGWNLFDQCDVTDWTGIVAIAAGGRHTVGLRADGTVLAVGLNDVGQCDTASWHLGTIANRAPVAGTYQMATSAGLAKSISLSKLVQACSDPDGDSLSITAVRSDSAAGGNAQINGAFIFYTPPDGFVGSDSFSYTVSDSRGTSSEGTVQVVVSASTGNSLNLINLTIAPGGEATIHCAGIPGVTYILEASTDLAHWTTLGSATAGVHGLFELVDAQAGNYSSRYYRTRVDTSRP